MKPLRDRRAREVHDEVDSEGSWAISYGDMVTLLLGFFVLFFTVDVEKERADSLMSSLKMSLNSLDDRSPSSLEEPEGKDMARDFGVQLPSPEVEIDIEGLDLNLVDFNEKLIVDFVGVSFFDSGKVQLTPGGEKALKAFTERYLPYAGQYMVQVQAYTDHRPVMAGRRFSDNLELSALRSVAAMRVLQHAGIPLQRMRLSGLGELVLSEQYLQKSSNETNPGLSLDLARKVILVIVPETSVRGKEASDVG